jgi:hypothetical protein
MQWSVVTFEDFESHFRINRANVGLLRPKMGAKFEYVVVFSELIYWLFSISFTTL